MGSVNYGLGERVIENSLMLYRTKKIVGCLGCLLTALLVIALFSCSPSRRQEDTQPVQQYNKAHIEIVNGLPVVHLYGTPEEIGEQHGYLLKDEIISSKKWLDARYSTDEEREKAIADAAGNFERFIPQDYLKEIKALAGASGIRYDYLVFANIFIDTADFFKKTFHCSTFVAYGKASVDGSCYFGRNLDFPGKGLLHNKVFVYHPKGKFAFVSILWPGLSGVCTAMNEKGLAIAVNVVSVNPQQHGDALPQGVLYRMIMEKCQTIDEAVNLIKDAKRSGGWNVTLATKDNAAVVELNRETVAVRKAEKGIIYALNHFSEISFGMDFAGRDTKILNLKKSNYRQIDAEKVKDLLQTISLTPCHSVVIQPKELIMHVGLTGPQSFNQLSVKDLFEVKAATADNKK